MLHNTRQRIGKGKKNDMRNGAMSEKVLDDGLSNCDPQIVSGVILFLPPQINPDNVYMSHVTQNSASKCTNIFFSHTVQADFRIIAIS